MNDKFPPFKWAPREEMIKEFRETYRVLSEGEDINITLFSSMGHTFKLQWLASDECSLEGELDLQAIRDEYEEKVVAEKKKFDNRIRFFLAKVKAYTIFAQEDYNLFLLKEIAS